MSPHVLIVGAGLSGAVIAERLTSAGLRVTVIDERAHVAGNCHTERDPATGVMVHRYGPHIFHTDDAEVWSYIQRFGTFRPYVNRVKTVVRGEVFSLPINLHTLNQFYRTAMCPEAAATHVAQEALDITDPANFEEQALAMVGPHLYEAFLKGYTEKQWGVPATRLPASILKRLPMRFTYDDNYFQHRFQGIPEAGYTALVTRMLAGAEVRLGQRHEDGSRRYDHLVYSGPIDRYFGYRHGRLGYRSLRFEELRANDVIQGTAVLNYADPDTPWTRVSEHRYFAPWDQVEGSIAFREYPTACGAGDIPFYPLRLVDDKAMLAAYQADAAREANTTFVGRLGTYRYLDMDVCIAEAIAASDRLIAGFRDGGLGQAA